VNYKDYFKGKKILVIGLGDELEMLSEIRFLLKHKAQVLVFDHRSEQRISRALIPLKALGVEEIVCGIPLPQNIPQVDMVLVSHSVPYESKILDRVRAAGIPIEYPETLVLKLVPSITVIGIVGYAGTSTVTHLVSKILDKVFQSRDAEKVHTINPESQTSTLALLKSISKGDIVVSRIPESQARMYVESRICPHVLVITSLQRTVGTHRGSNQTQFSLKELCGEMLAMQTYNSFLVATDEVIDGLKMHVEGQRSKILRTGTVVIPQDWLLSVDGQHMRENIALAVRVAELFKIPLDTSREVIEPFTGLKGRLEPVKKPGGGIMAYNDSYSTCMVSVMAAAVTCATDSPVILVTGGKGSDITTQALSFLQSYVSKVIFLPGSSNIRLHKHYANSDSQYEFADSLDDAIRRAYACRNKDQKIVVSPGTEHYGQADSRRDRYEIVQLLLKKHGQTYQA
jgi:UDP-N-acetylmuramoylalanine-D-glutamate ligase